MTQFKCFADGCNRILPRARSPVDCATRDRCEFRECTGAEIADSSPALPLPVPPKPSVDVPAVSTCPIVSTKPVPPLMIVIQGQAFEVFGETLLGRQGKVAIDIFRKYTDVSREHCTLKPSPAGWELKVDSANSPTSLDGRIIPSGQSVILTEERHYLLLGEVLPLELHLPAMQTAPPFSPSPVIDEVFESELEKFLRTEV